MEDFRDPYGHILVLVVFHDGDEGATAGKGSSIIGMDEFNITIHSSYASLEAASLVVGHVVGRVSFAVFGLSWEPCLDIRAFGIRFPDIKGTLLEFLVRDLELLHEILLDTGK